MQPSLRSTIGDLVARAARRVPARMALTFGPRSWTYAELDRAAERVARALLERGLRRGDRVTAFGRNSDAYLLLWLGVAKAGLVHVPFNYALVGDELAYLLRQSSSRALFCDPDLAAKIEVLGERGRTEIAGTLRDGGAQADVLAWAQRRGGDEPLAVDLDDREIVQLLYTSGTTALPKGAMLTHRSLVYEYASCALALDLNARDRPLHALPLYHSAQMHVFLMPSLMAGASNWLLETPDPDRVLESIAKLGATSFFAPPTVWIALLSRLEKDAAPAATLQKAYYGASIMPVPVLQRLRELLPGLGFYNCFGQSEIGPLATVLRPEEHDARPASAGKAVPFVDLRVVDDEGRDVPPGSVGEVVYRSPQLCLGYWEKPEETEAAFAGGWFHSGDLASIDEEGYITIVDRKKDVIKTGGVVVSSREIEEAIYKHPSVREVAVIPLPDPKWIEAVSAVIVLRPGAAPDADSIVDHLRGQLAPFKLPKHVFFVEELPRNASGKLLKRLLRERFAPAAGR